MCEENKAVSWDKEWLGCVCRGGQRSDIHLFWGSWSQVKGPCFDLVLDMLSNLPHLASIYMLSAHRRTQLLSVASRGQHLGVWVWGAKEKGAVNMQYLHRKVLAPVVLWQKLLVVLVEIIVVARVLPRGPPALLGRRDLASALMITSCTGPSSHVQTLSCLKHIPGSISCRHHPCHTLVSLFIKCLGISRAQYRIDG